VNNWNNCDFSEMKENTTDLINQCTVIQLYFCCNIHNGIDALNYFGSWQVTEFSQQLAISNPTRSDLKYPSDFGFPKKCQIPSDSDADAESVTSLLPTFRQLHCFFPSILSIILAENFNTSYCTALTRLSRTATVWDWLQQCVNAQHCVVWF